jgi:hypothetical protein
MDKGLLPVVPTSKSKQSGSEAPPISMQELQRSLSSYFDDVQSSRVNRTKHHSLKDILVIAILSTIAGREGWEDMENYGISKQQWLQKFLDLPNGIPSYDTFRRFFEKLDPKVLEQKLTQWVKQLIGPVALTSYPD